MSYDEKDLLVISVKEGKKKTMKKRKEREEAFARYVREELQPEDLDDEGLPLLRCRAMFDNTSRATYRRFFSNNTNYGKAYIYMLLPESQCSQFFFSNPLFEDKSILIC